MIGQYLLTRLQRTIGWQVVGTACSDALRRGPDHAREQPKGKRKYPKPVNLKSTSRQCSQDRLGPISYKDAISNLRDANSESKLQPTSRANDKIN